MGTILNEGQLDQKYIYFVYLEEIIVVLKKKTIIQLKEKDPYI